MNEQLFKTEFDKAWAQLESNMAHHIHDKEATQTAFGFTFKSTVPVAQIENLESKLKHAYMNESRGFCDLYISCVNIPRTVSIEPFDWSKANVVEQRGNYSRY